MEDTWLQNLKVGDTVYVSGGHYGILEKATVTRFTATQIVVSSRKNLAGEDYEEKFRRDSGRMVGGTCWSTTSLEEATPELIEKIRLQNLRNRVTKALQSIVVPKDLITLEALYAAIQPYLPVEKKPEAQS